ncbi:MAG: hypothetical protein HYZ14_07580 [Bacteroidetes bacterium]|nr:hypothetical protein [Bacteroidota bacterium]
MSRVVVYVFDSLFERKETVSYREKSAVVVAFCLLIIVTTITLILI